MFGWSILFPLIKCYGTIPITGILTKNLHLHLSEAIFSVQKPPSPY